MKPRNARFIDDLINGTNRSAVYKHVRDGHVEDVAEVLAGLESRIDDERAREALLHFAWMLIETRDTRGSEEARKRDKLVAQIRAEPKSKRVARKPTKLN